MKIDAAVSDALYPPVIGAPAFGFSADDLHSQRTVLIFPEGPEMLENMTICIGAQAVPEFKQDFARQGLL